MLSMCKEKSTRQIILELLKKNQELSVKGIKDYLDITEMAIRKHLVKLEADKLITSRTVRQPMGRPVIYYSLTAEGHDTFPNSYDKIVVEILQDIQENLGNEAIDTLFKNREERLRKKYQRRIFSDDPLTERVDQLVQVQRENGYMAEYSQLDKEGQEEDAIITFEQFNCPIAAIADRNDTPCQYELALFKEVLGTEDVKRVECMAKGGKSCKYVIKQDEKLADTTNPT